MTATDPAVEAVQGWAPCRAVLAGSELVSDTFRAGLSTEPTNNLLLLDGELQQAVRRLVAPVLTRSALGDVGRELDDLCADLVASVLDRPGVDLVADLAEPVVLHGILSVMGIPPERRRQLGDLTRGMLGLLEPDLPPAVRRRASSAALRATLLFERDGANGTATGLHAVLEAAARDGVIPVKLARSTPVVLLHGGYENPLNLLACVIAWAVENPERFRVAATAAPSTVLEEILRVYSPVRRVARWAADDGAFMWVDLESANHDHDRFPTADEPDFSRRRGHLGFGHGAHICPGTTLARLEGHVLIRSLLTVPVEVLGGFTVEWRDGVVAHGPATIVRR